MGFVLIFLFWVSGSFGAISVSDEERLGRELLKEILTTSELINDPEVVGYVNGIGERILEAVSPKYFDCRFFVVKDGRLNAFALPGGYIFITSGLLEELDSEDELAAVMAHEVAHVEARHVAKRLEALKRLQIATGAATIAGFLLGGVEAGSAVAITSSAIAMSSLLAYSRADEREADRLGFEYMSRAGYDPRAFVSVLNKIMRHRWLLTENEPSYLLTHPTPPERINYLETLAETFRVKKRERDILYLRRIQLRVKALSRDPNSLVVRYRELLKVSPNDPMLHYGLAVAYLKKRFFSEAEEELKKVLESYPERVYFRLDLAELYFLKGDYAAAAKVLEDYLRRRPSDAVGWWYLARVYQELGLKEKSLSCFSRIRREFFGYPEFHYYYGKLLFEAGRAAEAHYEFGVYFLMKGDGRVALYHFKKALRLLPKDHPLRTKISSYLRIF